MTEGHVSYRTMRSLKRASKDATIVLDGKKYSPGSFAAPSEAALGKAWKVWLDATKTYVKSVAEVFGEPTWQGHIVDVVELFKHDMKFHFDGLCMEHIDPSRVDYQQRTVKLSLVAPCTDGAANVVKSASQVMM